MNRSSSVMGPAVMPSGGSEVRRRYSWKRRFEATDVAIVFGGCFEFGGGFGLMGGRRVASVCVCGCVGCGLWVGRWWFVGGVGVAASLIYCLCRFMFWTTLKRSMAMLMSHKRAVTNRDES